MTTDWPYPRWIAHRGAGQLAPENTLASFRLGARHGFRMFECDVKLSQDGVPFLLHDAALERTTSGTGLGGDLPWHSLAQLDAGSWHSRQYAGEPLPCLENIAHFCRANNYHLNIEIKPTPGRDTETGTVVAQQAARLWAGEATPPLLSSFSIDALHAAQASMPSLPRALLLHDTRADWLAIARRIDCAAVVCRHTLWDAASVAAAHAAGLRCLSYTVNDAAIAQQLNALGTDGIITDRVDLFAPG